MTDDRDPIGIIAGGGIAPRRLADHLAGVGRPFVIAALEGYCDPATVDGHPHFWSPLGAAGRILDGFAQAGACDLCMVGRVARPTLSALKLDAKAAALLPKLGIALWRGDDALLTRVKELFEEEGFRIRGIHSLMADLLAKPGCRTSRRPSEAERIDIERGWQAAKALGAADIGQGVVVQQGLILCAEGIEGTDAMIDRVPSVRRPGSDPILVKVAKPQQTRVLDLPTVGPDTVRFAAKVGLAGIVVEAGASLILDEAEVVAAADAAGLFLIASEYP